MDKAQALICTAKQEFSICEIDIPELCSQDILIRTLYSGVSIGTELLLIRGKHNWGPFPICTGYQAVGVVKKVGADVTKFKIGDNVYFRGWNVPMQLSESGKPVTPTSGTHSSYAVVDSTNPTHGAALLPEGIDESVASLFVMPAVGLNGINMAGVKGGDIVVVMGVGLIGLGVVGCSVLHGASVIAIDIDENRLKVAKELGASYAINAQNEDFAKQMMNIIPEGADVVFEASGNPQCVDIGFSLCKYGGKFVFQGDFGNDDISFNFRVPHAKRITAYFPCDDGYEACRKAVLDLIAKGNLQWHKVITHKIRANESPAFYAKLLNKEIPNVLGIIIDWSDT